MAIGIKVSAARMAWVGCAVIALVAVCGLAGTGRAAENNQTVVLGGGIGSHTFAKSDDVRQGISLFGGADEIKNAGMSEVYLEWYALGTVGFGLRVVGLGATRTYTIFTTEVKQTLQVDLGFLTVNWVPVGATSYARLGLLAGAGSATYRMTTTVTGQPDLKGSATGSATLLGIYIDWGGEDFGARFGANSISTSLGDFTTSSTSPKLKVDGSGTSVYLDLRWAW